MSWVSSLRGSSFALVAMKIGALAAACGGPLAISDRLRIALGDEPAFGLGFSPVAMLLFGWFSLRDFDEDSRFDRSSLWLGAAGALLLLGENLYAGLLWFGGSGLQNAALVAIGSGVGSVIAVVYLVVFKKQLNGEIQAQTGPSNLDAWGLVVVGFGFAGLGLLLLAREPKLGAILTMMFGACGALGVATLLRRRRYKLPSAKPLHLQGGKLYTPSRVRMALVFGGAALACALLAGLGELFPEWLRWVLGVIAVGLTLGLIAVALGKLPVGSVRFDDRGIHFGERAWTVSVPWSAITEIAGIEVHDNPALIVRLVDVGAVEVAPPEARQAALSRLQSNEGYFGAPLMLMTFHYGFELTALLQALGRYLREPATRAELRP